MAEIEDPLRRPRRFYAEASIEQTRDGFALRLDGRTPRSPGARGLVFPTAALADLVAGEWRAQAVVVDYRSMPATRLAHTALDVVANARAASIEAVTRFGGADLICYFADHPRALVQRQEKVWAPLLTWASEDLGLRFERTSGIVHRPQPPETMARLEALVFPLDEFSLAGLAFAAALFGSAILALALRAGHIGAETAMAAARLDEIFQEEQWGVDAEAEAKADAMAVEAVMAERWFAALA
jgi:chaperone required for assembly of F1-ATPase